VYLILRWGLTDCETLELVGRSRHRSSPGVAKFLTTWTARFASAAAGPGRTTLAHHATRTIPRNGTAKRRSPEMYSCFSTSVSQQTIARSVQFPVPQKM
jgi:hypothetical protein